MYYVILYYTYINILSWQGAHTWVSKQGTMYGHADRSAGSARQSTKQLTANYGQGAFVGIQYLSPRGSDFLTLRQEMLHVFQIT